MPPMPVSGVGRLLALDYNGVVEDLSREDARLTSLMQAYVGEAEFFAQVLFDDLSHYPVGTGLIEVGAGIGLLSLAVSEMGFIVDSYEPESAGFTDMQRLRGIVERNWHGTQGVVRWHPEPIARENDPSRPTARYAFAIHVLEHVPAPTQIALDTVSNLTASGKFRAIGPNYAVPYEPHLNIPTLFSKDLTHRFMHRFITRASITNVETFWQELSWTTARGLTRDLKSVGLQGVLSDRATRWYFQRLVTDAGFLQRKGLKTGHPAVRALAQAGRVIGITPRALLPLIDCTISRINDRGTRAI